jgi:hypothetical protein
MKQNKMINKRKKNITQLIRTVLKSNHKIAETKINTPDTYRHDRPLSLIKKTKHHVNILKGCL